jgi:hypothetical protein
MLGNLFQQWTFICSQAHVLQAGDQITLTSLIFSRLSHNSSYSLLHSLNTDQTENSQQKCSSTVAERCLLCHSLATVCLQSCFLAMAVSAGLTILTFNRYATIGWWNSARGEAIGTLQFLFQQTGRLISCRLYKACISLQDHCREHERCLNTGMLKFLFFQRKKLYLKKGALIETMTFDTLNFKLMRLLVNMPLRS